MPDRDGAEQQKQASPSEGKGGSFGAGFGMGLFAGLVGYYLFGTSQGKQMRAKISGEWDKAKEKLKTEGVWDDPDASLRDLVERFAKKMTQVVNTPTESKSKKKTATGHQTLKKTARETAKPKQFKGAK